MSEKKVSGKRNNPDYSQVTAYIPTSLHLDVKRKLIGNDKDFSTLVEDLLRAWLARHSKRT